MLIENTLLPRRRDMVLMRKRPLGETGIEVPWVGLSTRALAYTASDNFLDSVVNSIKQGVVPDADAVHLIKNALDMQCNVISVAPTWGRGRAERLVGEAIKERRSKAVVLARAGRSVDGEVDFSARALEKNLEESLRRLKSDYVDVLLLHCPPDELLDGAHPAWAALLKLKEQGKIRALGASFSGSQRLMKAAQNTPAQVLQTRFSIFNQEAAAAFKVIKQKRLGLLIDSPLDSGFLGGRYGRFSVFFDPRKRWSRTQVWRRGVLRDQVEALRPASVGLAQMAIQFVLAHEAVSCVVAGSKDPHQLIYNVDSAGGVIEDETMNGLRKLWKDQIEGAGLSC